MADDYYDVHSTIEILEVANKERLVSEVREIVLELAGEYQRQPGSILSEEDLRWLLSERLRRIDGLGNASNNADEPPHLSTPIHNQIAWRDSSGRFELFPDITIIDPRNLKVNAVKMPHKGSVFWGRGVLLELKFLRRSVLTKKQLAGCKHDVKKIDGVLDHWKDGSVTAFQVVFRKHRSVSVPADARVSGNDRHYLENAEPPLP